MPAFYKYEVFSKKAMGKERPVEPLFGETLRLGDSGKRGDLFGVPVCFCQAAADAPLCGVSTLCIRAVAHSGLQDDARRRKAASGR